jgi:hypothetical protein
MARANLTAMLGRLDDDEPTIPTAVASSTPQPATSAPSAATTTAAPGKANTPPSSPRANNAKSAAKPRAKTPVKATSTPATPTSRADQPLFLRLERKEARLRADQYADLTAHARRLSQAKTGGGERITENTLIRVAIDLLLEHAADLSGQTEAEIKNSVTL